MGLSSSIEARIRHHAPTMELALPHIVAFVAALADGYAAVDQGQFNFSYGGSYVLVRAIPPGNFEDIEFVLSGVRSSSFIRINPTCFQAPAKERLDFLMQVRADLDDMVTNHSVQKYYQYYDSKITLV